MQPGEHGFLPPSGNFPLRDATTWECQGTLGNRTPQIYASHRGRFLHVLVAAPEATLDTAFCLINTWMPYDERVIHRDIVFSYQPVDWMAACNKIFRLHSKLSCMLNMFDCVNSIRQCPNMKRRLKGITLATINASVQKSTFTCKHPIQKRFEIFKEKFNDIFKHTLITDLLDNKITSRYWKLCLDCVIKGLKLSRFRTAYVGRTCTLFHLAHEGIPVATSLTIPV